MAGSVLLLGHGLLAAAALAELHRATFLDRKAGWIGQLLLAGCWLSGVFWATFLFRLLGLWCYRSRAGRAGPSQVPHDV